MDELDVKALCSRTEGWTPAQILSWIQNACENALSEKTVEDVSEVDLKLPQISIDHLNKSFDISKPRLKDIVPKMSPGVKLTFA